MSQAPYSWAARTLGQQIRAPSKAGLLPALCVRSGKAMAPIDGNGAAAGSRPSPQSARCRESNRRQRRPRCDVELRNDRQASGNRAGHVDAGVRGVENRRVAAASSRPDEGQSEPAMLRNGNRRRHPQSPLAALPASPSAAAAFTKAVALAAPGLAEVARAQRRCRLL